jgi:small-conductance mechanosensitive channel
VRFQAMGESGLRFSLMVWIDDPFYRDEVVDLVNTRIYKALNKHNIEIPYNKLDVFVKQMVEKQWQPPAELPIDADIDNPLS